MIQSARSPPGTLEAAWQPKAAGVFYRRHLLWPALVFVTLSWLLMGGLHLDQWIADRLYAWEGHAWTLEHNALLQDVLHARARHLSVMAWYAVALLCVVAWVPWSPVAKYRMPLLLLTVATITSTAIVGWMKTWTNVDCPWDLQRYGGLHAFVGLFAHRPSVYGAAKCFPAGHASAGYCWLALYFFFWMAVPRLRWLGLGLGLGLGLLYGGVQQLRGAHFLSHDVWTAMICWCTALVVFRLGALVQVAARRGVLPRKPRQADFDSLPTRDH